MNVHLYDGITPELNRLAGRLRNTQGLMRVMGGELRAVHQEHFRGRNQSIYRRIAQATQLSSVTQTEAVVSVGGTEGPILLHKIKGGIVRAKTVSKLAIPSRNNRRKGIWPREYPADKLVPLFGRNGVYALADARAVETAKASLKRTRKRQGVDARKAGREAGLRGKVVKAFGRAVVARLASGRASQLAQMLGSAILFFLKESVYHRPDANALPPQASVESRLLTRLRLEAASLIALSGRR